MLQLLVSLIGLLLGPFTHRLSRRRVELYGFLDGFVLVGVSGLILTEVLPDTVSAAGGWALALAAAGFVMPLFLERRLALMPFSPNAFFRWLMILGLLLHQILDGVALSAGISHPAHQGALTEGSPGGGSVWLQWAVILHQIPKGFFIWAMVGEALGTRMAVAVIGGLCLATIGGFGLGDRLTQVLDARPLWLFQAFIGGGLLHVIVHHAPREAASDPCCEEPSAGGVKPFGEARRFSLFSGLGALLSIVALVWIHWGTISGQEESFLAIFAKLIVENAKWILLGFAAAGIFQAFLPRVIVSWFRVKGRMSQALRGVALGLPLPLCSCGVVPVYLSLLKKSVPPAAALAFLIATPEIGIDSFFLSGNLLGMEITLIRVVMAFIIAVGVALTLARTFEKTRGQGELDSLVETEERPVPPTLKGKLREALRFGGREIVDHTGAWLLVGLAVAAIIGPSILKPWVHEVRERFPDADVLLLSLLGLPLYVCASGATPLAAMLIQNGISTGAALAFLITGPSTNITTFGILKKYHGLKGALLFVGAVYGFSIAIGFAINHLFPGAGQIPGGGPVHPESPAGPVDLATTAILGAVFAGSLLRLGPRGFLATLGEGMGGAGKADSNQHSPAHGHGHSHS